MPFGSVVGLIVGAGGKLMVMLKPLDPVCGGLLLSVTTTVKLVVLLGPVGVPVMCPDVLISKPAGKLPVTVNV